jgi:hypothetical protein
MPNYAVFVEGNDFQLSRNGRKEVVGFFVTVRVVTDSEREAASCAIEVVRSDPMLQEAFRPGAGPIPRIQVKVVHELMPDNKMKNTQFTFFPMEEK